LALSLGCTVSELGARLSSAELTEWLAFDLLEPIGGARDDDRARGIMAVVAASAGAKDVKPSDFLRTWQPKDNGGDAEKLALLLAKLDRVAIVEGD
jgi:hypothetical protein